MDTISKERAGCLAKIQKLRKEVTWEMDKIVAEAESYYGRAEVQLRGLLEGPKRRTELLNSFRSNLGSIASTISLILQELTSQISTSFRQITSVFSYLPFNETSKISKWSARLRHE